MGEYFIDSKMHWFNLMCLLQCNGSPIDWKLVIQLYTHNAGAHTATPGLSLVHKLRYEHVYLTNFSKMRVDLAAQVSLLVTAIIVIHECI